MPSTQIVIVDDSAPLRTLLKQVLKNAKFNVVGEAATARSALELIERLSPDIVCLDIELPDGNGLELLTEIRSRSPQSRVIMVTGDSERSSVEQAIRAGASGYMVKPFRSADVLQLIRKISANC